MTAYGAAARGAGARRTWVVGLAVFAVTLVFYSDRLSDDLVLAADRFASPVEPLPWPAAWWAVAADSEAVRSGAIIACAAVSAAAAAVARRHPWPLFAATAVGAVLFSSWPGFLAASYYAGTTLRRGAHIALAGAAGGALLLGVPALHHALGTDFPLGPDHAITPVERGLSPLFVIGMPLVIGLWVRARRQVVTALAERAGRLEGEHAALAREHAALEREHAALEREHAALEREHAALEREHAARAEQARITERARIAREMHDVVAHKVSLMVLHAGALEVAARDDDTARTAELVRATGREALTDLREVLGVLRAPGTAAEPRAPAPGLADLDRLLDASRAAGLTVERHDEGERRPLPAAVERAAHRVVQEALTNVHKHAGCTTVVVSVRYLPDSLAVSVRNSAPEAPSWHPLPGSGLGLVGLRERLELLGGRLRAGPEPGAAFVVRANIPTGRRGAGR
ncbi:hypothetical protein GCM10018785_02230 [Streptomyces longispororuber]|uniref:histidine kinase n=1 Tax=Streptomyces longispororuber TaxID=68230 RepID=A0A918Z4R2_9ACTN|nr:hypothetical protein GCM10018785_02230 [Streptomyces longispororuber]